MDGCHGYVESVGLGLGRDLSSTKQLKLQLHGPRQVPATM
jgi:hypothetical protein